MRANFFARCITRMSLAALIFPKEIIYPHQIVQKERFIRPAARTFRVGEIYYIAYRILTIFPFRSISVQVTRHRVPYIISRVSSNHGTRTLFNTLRHFRLIRIRESSNLAFKCVLLFFYLLLVAISRLFGIWNIITR